MRVDLIPWDAEKVDDQLNEGEPLDRLDVDDAQETGLTLGTFRFAAREYDHEGDPSDRRTVVDLTVPDFDQLGTVKDWAGAEYVLSPTTGTRPLAIKHGDARYVLQLPAHFFTADTESLSYYAWLMKERLRGHIDPAATAGTLAGSYGWIKES